MRIVTFFLIIAPYKYSYLLTYLLNVTGSQEQAVSWSTSVPRSRAEMVAVARQLWRVIGAVACRDMSVGRAAMTSTNVLVDRVKMAERASTPSAVIGKPTSYRRRMQAAQAAHLGGGRL